MKIQAVNYSALIIDYFLSGEIARLPLPVAAIEQIAVLIDRWTAVRRIQWNSAQRIFQEFICAALGASQETAELLIQYGHTILS